MMFSHNFIFNSDGLCLSSTPFLRDVCNCITSRSRRRSKVRILRVPLCREPRTNKEIYISVDANDVRRRWRSEKQRKHWVVSTLQIQFGTMWWWTRPKWASDELQWLGLKATQISTSPTALLKACKMWCNVAVTMEFSRVQKKNERTQSTVDERKSRANLPNSIYPSVPSLVEPSNANALWHLDSYDGLQE